MSRSWLLALALLAACETKQADKREPSPVGVRPTNTKRIDLGESKPAERKPDIEPTDPFAGWAERKGDGFSVMAPQDPKVQTKSTTATGTPLPTTMYTHYVPDGPGALQVMFTELDPKSKVDAKTMFDAMKKSMVTQFSGTVKKQAEITIGKAKGQEYWLDGEHARMGKLSVHVKFLLSENRLYLVQSLYSADAAGFAAIGDKFVDSFTLQ